MISNSLDVQELSELHCCKKMGTVITLKLHKLGNMGLGQGGNQDPNLIELLHRWENRAEGQNLRNSPDSTIKGRQKLLLNKRQTLKGC